MPRVYESMSKFRINFHGFQKAKVEATTFLQWLAALSNFVGDESVDLSIQQSHTTSS